MHIEGNICHRNFSADQMWSHRSFCQNVQRNQCDDGVCKHYYSIILDKSHTFYKSLAELGNLKALLLSSVQEGCFVSVLFDYNKPMKMDLMAICFSSDLNVHDFYCDPGNANHS